jgi:hypothetical protein
MRRLTGLTAVSLATIAAALAGQASVASATPTDYAGTLYYSKITCEFNTPGGCGATAAPPFAPFTFLVAVVSQVEGSGAVTVRAEGPVGMQATTSTLSGNQLEWSFVGILPESRGIKNKREKVYKITFSASGLRWSGTSDESFSEESGGVSTKTTDGRFAIEGDRVPLPGLKAAKCSVPRVKGRTLVSAENAIVKGGCAVGRVTRTKSRRVKKGRVISQSVAPGISVATSTKVSLVVSKGS